MFFLDYACDDWVMFGNILSLLFLMLQSVYFWTEYIYSYWNQSHIFKKFCTTYFWSWYQILVHRLAKGDDYDNAALL